VRHGSEGEGWRNAKGSPEGGLTPGRSARNPGSSIGKKSSSAQGAKKNGTIPNKDGKKKKEKISTKEEKMRTQCSFIAWRPKSINEGEGGEGGFAEGNQD